MAIRYLTVALPVVVSLGLAACDSRDYEAEIATLQDQLGAANSELDTLRGENETLISEMDQLRAQAEQGAAGAGALAEDTAAAVRSQLEGALEQASQTADQLAALEAEPDAPAAVGALRSSVEEIVNSVQSAAAELGLELQAGVEPAAGAEEPAEPAAGGQAGQSEAAPEQPADETAPQQQ
jgi:chromosome segregation ATPase